jgi:hypothetical protein
MASVRKAAASWRSDACMVSVAFGQLVDGTEAECALAPRRTQAAHSTTQEESPNSSKCSHQSSGNQRTKTFVPAFMAPPTRIATNSNGNAFVARRLETVMSFWQIDTWVVMKAYGPSALRLTARP